MKKFLKMSTMFALLIAVCLGFVGCKQPVLDKINVDLDTIQTEYYVGQAQETYENAKVYAIYDNGDQKLIDTDSTDLVFSTISTAQVGTQTLTVSYKEKTQEISITIREKRVVSIEVTGLKTAYVLGDTQDNTCTVTATYEDGSTETANANDVTFSTISTAEEGPQTITVTYKGVSKTISAYVNAKAIDRIELDEESIKTTYYYGDTLESYESAEVTVYYQDGTDEVVPFEELTFSNNITTTPSNLSVPQVLVITHKGVSTYVVITVNERVIESIEIVETGLKLSYDICETVDSYANLQIKINYTNDTDQTVLVSSLTGAVVTKPTTDTTGTKTLKVEYKGFEDTATVTVTEKEVKTVNLAVSDTTYVKGDEYLDNVTVTLTYTDDSTRTLTTADATFEDVDFGAFDITKSGYQTLTATYADKTSNSVDITVYSHADDAHAIIGYELPTFVSDYYENIAIDQGEQTAAELEQEFKSKPVVDDPEDDLDDMTAVSYYVGNLNAFKFLPEITAFNGEPIVIKNYKSVFTVLKWNEVDEEYVDVTNDQQIVVIDDEKSELNFGDNVTGLFKISVKPYFYNKAALTFKFHVSDGYNVYEASQLSIFDNTNLTETNPDDVADYERFGNGAWTEFKQNHGLSDYLTGNAVKGLFLHNDISVEKEDVTDKFFFKKGDLDLPTSEYGYPVIGSLIDYTYVYERHIPAGETFTLNGNYFSLNLESFPLIAAFDTDNSFDRITHSSLFWVEGEGDAVFTNIKMFGNAQKAEEKTYAGGLIMAKVGHGSQTTFENTITRSFGITVLCHFDAILDINNSKAFDNFSNFIYSHGKTVTNITNSEFKRCGGPVVIVAQIYDADETEESEATGKDQTLYGVVTADASTIMENYVVGEEAWFAVTGQKDLALAVKGELNTLITNTTTFTSGNVVKSKSIISYDSEAKVEKINLIAVIMDSKGPTGNNPCVKGKFMLDNSGVDLLEDPVHEQLRVHELAQAAPLFQVDFKETIVGLDPDSGTPISAISGTKFLFNGTAMAAPTDPTTNLAGQPVYDALNDDYIGVSYSTGGKRIGVLLGLTNTEKAAQ